MCAHILAPTDAAVPQGRPGFLHILLLLKTCLAHNHFQCRATFCRIFRCASISCTGQLESHTETGDQPFVCSLAICLVFYTTGMRSVCPDGFSDLLYHAFVWTISVKDSRCMVGQRQQLQNWWSIVGFHSLPPPLSHHLIITLSLIISVPR